MMMEQDPYASAASQLGGNLRGRSIQQIMESLQDPIAQMQTADLSPVQEKEEDPISEKIMEFISKLQGKDEEENGLEGMY